MTFDAETVAQVLAIGITALCGVGLLTVSPILLLLGAWGGSDSGSIPTGIALVLGLPWAIYLGCAGGMAWLLVRRRPLLAAIVSAVPLVPALWVASHFVR